MVWGTLRGIPKTRNVYEERANGKQSSVARKMWLKLLRSSAARGKRHIKTEKLSSSLFIGAQARNAERVPFVDEQENNLLLSFWPLVSPIYVPRVVTADGKTEVKGYVLAVPEPCHLEHFLPDVEQFLANLPTEPAGYLPRASLVDLPEEGGLEYLHSIVQHRARQTDFAFSVSGVELYHLEKQGKNTRILSSGRILPDPVALDQYGLLRKSCDNPLYKSQRIHNLLVGGPWYDGMDGVFSEHPWEFFVQTPGKTPRTPPFFAWDAKRAFHSIEEELKLQKGGAMTPENGSDDKLARRVYQLTRAYVMHRTEDKAGLSWKAFIESTRQEDASKYREVNAKVCSDAFLAMRGRRDADFVEYFTGTICSVPQYLPEDEFLGVSAALMSDWQKVKTLSMLALSAHSQLPTPGALKGDKE